MMPGTRRRLLRPSMVGALFFLLAVVGAGAGMAAWVLSRGSVPTVSRLNLERAEETGGRVVVAGSGVALPLLERLADAFNRQGSVMVRVAPSIGSGGGLAALGDRVIDCAVVSRPLAADEVMDRQVIPFVESRVILAAGRTVKSGALDRSRLLSLYAGEEVRWEDGAAAEVILREPGDSATEVFIAQVEGFSEAMDQGASSRGWRVALTDQEMQGALLSRPGAVGLFDPGIVRILDLPLRALDLEGMAADGLRRRFSLVLRTSSRDEVRGFVDFVCSPGGRKIIEGYGYQALPCAPETEGPDGV